MDIRAHCRDKAFFAFGTSKIFELRLHELNRFRNCITYLGIVVPLMVGGIALSFDTKILPYVAIPAGILGSIQLALSAWSLVARWDEKHAYALSALQAQTKLYNLWDNLARRDPPDLEQQATTLDAEDQRQESQDLSQNISKKEQNYGMRAALFHFGIKCKTCDIKPLSLKASMCDTCGNF